MDESQVRFTNYYASLLKLPENELLGRFNQYEKIKEKIINLLEIDSHKTILDIGCGAGFLDILLSHDGHNVTGIDINPAAILLGKRLSTLYKTKTTLFVKSLLEISSKSRFDVILIWDVLFPMFPTDEENNLYIKQCAQILNPSGKILIETYNKDYAVRHGIESCYYYEKTNNIFKSNNNEKAILYSHDEILSIARHNNLHAKRVAGWKSVSEYNKRNEDDPADIYVLTHQCVNEKR